MIERIGIVGGGQLGRMMTEAAKPLGFEVTVIDPVENCPAGQVGADQIQAPLSDLEAIDSLAHDVDVITWEIEHIPAEYLEYLANEGHDIEPDPHTLAIIQDKFIQKELLRNNGIPVAPYSEHLDESNFIGGGPFIVKSRKGGYDGRGNLVVTDLNRILIEDHFGETSVYVEQVLPFEAELSVIVARDKSGQTVAYPPVETVHEENICHTVVVAQEDSKLPITKQAIDIAQDTLKLLSGAGVFAIEMFVVNGQIVVNEIAPRVHNSGHHTIEANVTSQFEQQIRAVTGLPLGSTELRVGAAAMINILGTREKPLTREGLDRVLSRPDTHVHFYGKSSRPARKIGHITVLGGSKEYVKLEVSDARKELII